MPAQYPFGTANDAYRKRLFVDTGMEYQEVKARIIEPYSPPAPSLRNKEIEVIHAPSNFHSLGLSSYKISFSLLFDSKQDYAEYMIWCGWTHKFYDERGQIYLGAVDSLVPKAHEASRRYVVDVTLTAIKKDTYERKHRQAFQDIRDADGQDLWYTQTLEKMADLGLIAVLTKDNSPVLYFRPNDVCTRAEFTVFLNRTRRFLERVIRE